jgi:hypothetical protein
MGVRKKQHLNQDKIYIFKKVRLLINYSMYRLKHKLDGFKPNIAANKRYGARVQFMPTHINEMRAISQV